MEDWHVSGSDGEDASDYQPDPTTIVKLYNLINSGELPPLQTFIHPRDKLQTKELQVKQESPALLKSESIETKTSPSEPNEFDFDSQSTASVKRFTPKRTPNRPQQKKVARMDKVCSNILKYKKLDEEQMQKENKETP
uniref:PAXIP1-associated glutamate-rich protein 1 n=2 Tax=Ciona intestinalis TaxID=7719 RepID=H2XKC6_CIOIN